MNCREFVIIYRKILLTFLSFLSRTNLETRGYIVFYIITIACCIHYWAQPYFSSYYNELELKSLIISLGTVYFGLFFVIDVNEFSQAIMFMAIIAINSNFLLLWVTGSIKILIESAIDSSDLAVRLSPVMKPIIGLISSKLLI